MTAYFGEDINDSCAKAMSGKMVGEGREDVLFFHGCRGSISSSS